MIPADQRQALVHLILAVADARATNNPKLYQWATAAAEKELNEIVPDMPPKPTLADVRPPFSRNETSTPTSPP